MTQQTVKLVQRGREAGDDIVLAYGSGRDGDVSHEDISVVARNGLIKISIKDGEAGDIPIHCERNGRWDVNP